MKYREWDYNDRTVLNSRSSSQNIEIIYLDNVAKQVDKKKQKLNIVVDDAVKF